ncbi:probable calcium-binding protein CML22 isoform X3 [Zea mays]|uniref:EF-hand domain-containing protein n=1 Tax=Zea mays TaxID=4577 RepID=A0A804MIU8_MAIZE|nr:uncharacterized protein LOC100282374 isoform X3 [Zea mays]
MGMVASMCTEPIKRHRVERDLDGKVADALRERTRSRQRTFRSVNSITMRLPRFKEGLRDVKNIFDQYDEDSDGTIDSEELQSFGSRVRVHMSEEEMSNLHRYCDIDSRKGVQFQEFVVLLCLAYLLFGPDVTRRVRFGVRVRQAQLRLRRAHRRVHLLRQGRGRHAAEERRHPQDERGVAPGEDTQPHNSTAIQGDGSEQEREGEPQGVPLLHDQMGWSRDRRRWQR